LIDDLKNEYLKGTFQYQKTLIEAFSQPTHKKENVISKHHNLTRGEASWLPRGSMTLQEELLLCRRAP
jgi:hypothetical protein